MFIIFSNNSFSLKFILTLLINSLLIFFLLQKIFPNSLIDFSLSSISLILGLNLTSLFISEHLFIFSFICFTCFILSSILVHLLIIKYNLSSLFQSSSFILPCSKEVLILLGNFSVSLRNSSLIYNSLNFSSTSNKSLSSLSFNSFLNFVNIF